MLDTTALLTQKIASNEDLVIARQRARQIAALLNLNLQDQTKIATVVSELARNAQQYAGGGEIKFYFTQLPKASFRVVISDKGPGITDVSKALSEQQATQRLDGVINLGLAGSRKLVDNFSIQSTPGQGTTVTAEMYLPVTAPIMTTQSLARIVDELARHRPKQASEEVQQQNQELLQALALLAKARDELEERVKERTQALTITNEQLQNEISERQRIESWVQQHQQELAQAERLNSMGEIASALAHELNQPLTGITTYTQGCIRRLEADDFEKEELIKVMKRVAQQSERAGEIVHRMKDFVRKGELQLEEISLCDLIEETLIFMQHELQKTATQVELKLDNALPAVFVDRVQIQQVITNLIRNAIEAMEEAHTSHPLICIQTEMFNKDSLAINIIDNGPGFATQEPHLLFEPYFTTKTKGMGIGLSISRTIIEAHRGQLIPKPAPHSGAWFQCVLPL